jgi:hypothetical protein
MEVAIQKEREELDETLFDFVMEVKARDITTILEAIARVFAYPRIDEIKRIGAGVWRIAFEQIDNHRIGEFIQELEDLNE